VPDLTNGVIVIFHFDESDGDNDSPHQNVDLNNNSGNYRRLLSQNQLIILATIKMTSLFFNMEKDIYDGRAREVK
jgi:hypothetical protein